MKYRVELTAQTYARAFVTVEAASPEEANTLATGEGEVDMDVDWSPRGVVAGTVKPVDAYVLKEEDG